MKKAPLIKKLVWLVAFPLVVITAISLLIRLPVVQKKIADVVAKRISNQIGADVRLSGVAIKFFDRADLEGLSITDQNGDSLFFVEELDIDISLFSLVKKKINIDWIQFSGLQLYLKSFHGLPSNYDFLLNSFRSSNVDKKNPWAVNLERVELEDFKVHQFEQNSEVFLWKGGSLTLDIREIKSISHALWLSEIQVIENVISITTSDAGNEDESSTGQKDGLYSLLPHLGWQIRIDKLKGDDNRLITQTKVRPENPSMFDPANMVIHEWGFHFSDIKITDESWFAQLEQFSLEDKGGIDLKQVSGLIDLKPSHLSIHDLTIQTSTSALSMEDQLTVDLPNGKMGSIAGIISSCSINLKEASYFIPQIKEVVDIKVVRQANISGTFNGSMNKLIWQQGHFGLDQLLRASGTFEVSGYRDGQVSDVHLSHMRFSTHPSLWPKAFPKIDIPDPVRQLNRTDVTLHAHWSGNQLNLHQLDVITGVQNIVRLRGTVRDILHADQLTAQLVIDTLHFSRRLADQLFNYELPDGLIDLSGISYSGSIGKKASELRLAGKLNTDFGGIVHDLFIDMDDALTGWEYRGKVEATELDINRFVSGRMFEKTHVIADLEGHGLDKDSFSVNFDILLPSVGVDHICIDSIVLTGQATPSDIMVITEIRDPNLVVMAELAWSGSNQGNHASFIADVKNWNPQAFGLLPEVNTVSLKAGGTYYVNNQQTATYELLLDRAMFITDTAEVIFTDVRSSAMTQGSLLRNASVSSNFLDATLEGNIAIGRIIPLVNRSILAHLIGYTEEEVSGDHREDLDSLVIHGYLRKIPPVARLVSEKIPEADELTTLFFLDIGKDSLSISTNAKNVHNSSINFESLSLDVQKNIQGLVMNLNATNVSHTNGLLPHVRLDLSNWDSLTQFDVRITGDSAYRHLVCSGTVTIQNDTTRSIRLAKDILVEETAWDVESNYPLSWTNSSIRIKDLYATSGDRYLKMNGILPLRGVGGMSMYLDFYEFPIEYLVKPFAGNVVDLQGNMVGTVQFSGDLGSPRFVSDLHISGFRTSEMDLGDLTLKSDDLQNDRMIAISGTWEGESHRVNFNGSVKSALDSMDVRVELDRLSLNLMNAWTKDYLSFNEGSLSGFLDIIGPLDLPSLTGRINPLDATFRVARINSTYRLKEGTIHLHKDSVFMEDWTLQDERGKEASIAGLLIHRNYKDVQSDLRFTLDDFQLMKTAVEDNTDFYGNLYVSGTGSVKGPLSQPFINIETETSEGTILTMINRTTPGGTEEDQLVLFMSPDAFRIRDSISLAQTGGYPMNLNLNLSLTDKTTFKFIIDESTGDHLLCSGTGNLAVRYDPVNRFNLFGTYVVNEGRYDYSYDQLVNKKFEIQPGSSIAFSGDPMNSGLQVTAIYKLQTSVYGLIKNETHLTSAELNLARRKMPLEVHMIIRGRMEEPEIIFDIVVPESPFSGTIEDAVTQKLNQLKQNPTEMNNQVFALLLTNGFMISDGSTASVGSSIGRYGAGQTLSSLSSFFTNNLNDLADRYVKGVEIDFNVDTYQAEANSDYAASIVTQVGLGISKQLFNERLRISATGNLDIEGSGQSESNTTLMGNFILEYSLTPDGQYVLRVYRTDHHDTLTGEKSSKNGVGVVVKKAFDDRSK